MTRITSLLTVAVLGCGSSNNGTPDSSLPVDQDAPTTQTDGANPTIDGANPPSDGANPTIDGANPPVDGMVSPTTWPTPYAVIPLTSPDGSFWGPMVTLSGQKFMMDLDTGSTTIGVAGSMCTSCTGISPKYTPGGGATDVMKTTSTQYADGSGWSGEIFNDAINLGGNTPDVVMNLASMTKQTSFFFDNTYQGILGMGAKVNAEPNTDSYFDLGATSGLNPVMAFEICDAGTGTMWLGGYDETKASGTMAYTPLLAITSNQPFYAIDITGMKIGDTSVGTGAATFQKPIVDTGTTFFYVPTPVDKAIIAAINANASFKTLFGATAKVKDYGCVKPVAGTTVTAAMIDAMLPPYSMTMPGMNGGADITLTVKPSMSYLYDGGTDGWCYAIADGGTVDATTMGDTIMRAFITVIDKANHQVGWALDAGCAMTPHRPMTREGFRPHLPKPRNRTF